MANRKVPEKYDECVFEELEYQVDVEQKIQKYQKILVSILFVVIIMVFYPNFWLYWFRFGIPFPYTKTDEVINVKELPIWTDLSPEESEKFKYTALENKNIVVELKPLSGYSISGLVVAKNYFFWGNYLPGMKHEFHFVSLFDLGLVWADMADVSMLKKYYNFVSAKSVTARALYTTERRGKTPPYSWKKANSLFSHTHIIPASRAQIAALIYANKYEPVKLEGYLVDTYINGRLTAMTSLSNDDTNQTARGNFGDYTLGGSCEIMYVKRLVIGNRVYE